MLIEETIQKLIAMRLSTMAQATRELLQNAPSEQLSFEDKLGSVVDQRKTEPRLHDFLALLEAINLQLVTWNEVEEFDG